MLEYLFVRGGVHALAYAKALETLTGVEMSKMLRAVRRLRIPCRAGDSESGIIVACS